LAQLAPHGMTNCLVHPMQGLDGHPTRFLPVNYTRARWFCCPWAFASPPQLLSGRQALASAVCRRKERAAPTMMAGPVGRRTVLGAGAALFSVLVQGRAAVADGANPRDRTLPPPRSGAAPLLLRPRCMFFDVSLSAGRPPASLAPPPPPLVLSGHAASLTPY